MGTRPDSAASRFSRREFLTTGVGSAVLTRHVLAEELGWGLPTFRCRVLRDHDLLAVTFTFVNFRRVTSPGEALASVGDGRSTVVVEFPPQNIAEAVFVEEAQETGFEVTPIRKDASFHLGNSPVPPVTTYLAGPSRVAFMVPGVVTFPLAVGGRFSPVDAWLRRLAWCAIRLPRNAVAPLPPELPRPEDTCLELPFRLFLAPSVKSRWLSSADAIYVLGLTLSRPEGAAGHQVAAGSAKVTTDRFLLAPPRAGAVELWHAALLAKEPIKPATLPPGVQLPPELRPPEQVTLRAKAVFSPDYRTQGQPAFDLFYPARRPLSLHALTRHRLVKQMADGNGWVDAEHLILSALGASASLSYASQKSFDDILKAQLAPGAGTGETELAVWKHRVVVGRDVYFAEAFFGFLFPFVYPAVYVEITQRKFTAVGTKDEHGPSGAFLLKRAFIIAQQTDRQFTNSDSSIGRNMPIKRAVLNQAKSPPLQLPQIHPITGVLNKKLTDLEKDLPDDAQWKDVKDNKRLIFVPRTLEDGSPVRWLVTFTDESGRQSHSPLSCFLFADNVVLGQQIWESYLKKEFKEWRVPAQPIAYTPERPEIIVSRDVAAGQFAPGDPAYTFRFEEVERRAIKVLGIAVRNWLTPLTGDIAKQLDALGRLATATVAAPPPEFRDHLERAIKSEWGKVGDALGKLNGLRDEALKAIGQAAATIQQKVNNKEAALKELIRQLERAEEVSSTLETHLVSFGTKKVHDLFGAAKKELTDALGQVTTVKDYIAKVAGAASPLPDWVKNKVGQELDALKHEAWSTARPKIERYLGDIKNAEADAKKFGTDIFHAALDKAEVAIPALKALDPNSPAREVKLLGDYLVKGVNGVSNGVFARIEEGAKKVEALADKIKTGLAKPNAVIQGLSRELGALVSDGKKQVEDLARQVGELDLSNAIPDAKLFGVLPLRDVLGRLARGQLPTVNLIQLPDHWEHVWDWNTPLKSTDLWVVKFDAEGAGSKYGPARLRLVLRTRIDLPKPQELAGVSAPKGAVELRGFIGWWDEMKKEEVEPSGPDSSAFALTLLGLVRVRFNYLRLEAHYRTGERFQPSLTPKINKVEFLGPLKFIAELQKSLGDLGGGFRLELTPQAVGVRFATQLPPVSFGVFSLRNISLGAGLRLSLVDAPLRFDFNFSSWEKPFELTVMCFGGRGGFRMAIQSNGQRELEGFLEFGGSLAFDVVIASGGLYVMAGVYFKITAGTTDLSGYVRAGGNLSVLGLIHASVEFLLALHYEEPGGSLYGVAKVTVSIDLFLVSFDVTITMEKRFTGSGSQHSRELTVRPAAPGTRAAASPAAAPLAYFTRSSGVPGRFDSVEQWKREYWSQFMLPSH